MKVSFKPLSLALAVSAAVAGYAGTVNAQAVLAGNTSLGDLAIVPYYTVRGDWTTGVSVINTSDSTQVVKVRLRRATDSMDVLDFNLVLSPEDVWTGYLENNTAPGVEDQLRFYTNDKSCTAPLPTANANGPAYFAVPSVFADFAEEGYIELIGMGATNTELDAIAIASLHKADGVPLDCATVLNNFLRYGDVNQYFDALIAGPAGFTGNPLDNGVVNSGQTVDDGFVSNYQLPGNFMKVSWFIKDTTSGIEMGDNAIMIADFMDGPSMTNQVAAAPLGTEDLQGYDYPDLNGGAPLSAQAGNAAAIGKYDEIRALLGSRVAINDWSKNVQGDLSVDTDWVITAPGQYTMLNLPVYLQSIIGTGAFDPASKLPNPGCIKGDATQFPPLPGQTTLDEACDFRDLPLTVTPVVYDREEQSETVPPDQIVISPTPPGTVVTNELYYEVNVIEWGNSPVLDAAASTSINVDLNGAVFGWAALDMESTTDGVQAICSYVVPAPVNGQVVDDLLTCELATGDVPIVGFAAWQRNFESNPDANYGRAIRHSYGD